MFNPLPAIALLPLALLWFGLGQNSLIFVLVHSVLWALALNTYAGFLGVSETLRMAGRNYGLKGMRFVLFILIPAALPSILAGLTQLAEAGVSKVVAIVLSPQYSPLLMSGYARAIGEARTTMGDMAPEAIVAGAWHQEPAFVTALADRVADALARLPAGERDPVRILMTAHSLPRRVADTESEYLEQLRATANAVATMAGLTDQQWEFCWQSAGHEPGEWMKPDFADLMPEIAASGGRSVLVVPIQFLADHLEILYDVDVGARQQAESNGVAFHRIESLNAHPDLVEALAAVSRRTVSQLVPS